MEKKAKLGALPPVQPRHDIDFDQYSDRPEPPHHEMVQPHQMAQPYQMPRREMAAPRHEMAPPRQRFDSDQYSDRGRHSETEL